MSDSEQRTLSLWARHHLASLVANTVWPSLDDDLAGERTPEGGETMSAERWAALKRAAASERVVPALAAAVRDGTLSVTTEQAGEVDKVWNDRMRHCLRIEARLLWLLEQLEGSGVELRVLKGSAAAHLDHSRPELRQFGDLDVLVRGNQMAEVFEVLTGDGFRRRYPEPRPGFDRRFTKSVSFVGDVEIDVHRTLSEGPVGHRIPVDELWNNFREFEVAGVAVRALGDVERFLHACLHSHLGHPPARLLSLSDVATGVVAPKLDVDAVTDVARRWRVDAVVEAAVLEMLAVFGHPPDLDSRWLARHPLGLLDAMLIESHRQAGVSSAARAALGTLTLPGGRDRLAYLMALSFPQRSYGRDGAMRDGRWRRAGSQIVGAVRGTDNRSDTRDRE